MRANCPWISIATCKAKIVTLETLATSGSVNAHDYVRFYERALKLKALAGVDIALRDPDGQQLANTRVPWGAPLPRNPFQSDSNVLATKKPYVSDVIEGRLARQPVYFVSVPVIEGGAVTQLLHMTIDLSRLEAFVQGDIAAGQIAGVLDRNNIVMARTQDSTERIGKPASRDFVNQITGEEGTWLGRNIQGYTIRVGYERSKLSGWLIWVGVPDETIQSQLRQTLWTLSALGLALTILTIGAAYFFGGRLAAAAGALAAQAKALGRGDAMTAANIAVRELNDVGQELVAAGARRKELEQKLIAAATQESERRFQTIVQSVTDYAIFMLDPDGKVANWNAGRGGSRAIAKPRSSDSIFRPFTRRKTVPGMFRRALCKRRRATANMKPKAGACARMAAASGRACCLIGLPMAKASWSALPRSRVTSPNAGRRSSAWKRRASSSISRKKWTPSASSPAAWRTISTIY